MSQIGNFPFGQPIRKIEQKDQSPKRVFVLGVYASAVHARWSDKNGKQKVSALAVASEPEIFWPGDNAKKIIELIAPSRANFSVMNVTWVVINTVILLDKMNNSGPMSITER